MIVLGLCLFRRESAGVVTAQVTERIPRVPVAQCVGRQDRTAGFGVLGESLSEIEGDRLPALGSALLCKAYEPVVDVKVDQPQAECSAAAACGLVFSRSSSASRMTSLPPARAAVLI